MRVITSLLFIVCLTTGASSAAEVTSVNSKDGKTRIDFVGEIFPGDADKVKFEIQKANNANRLVATIRLNSGGGNLSEGVKVAELIRQGRIATSVLSNSVCASACFIIFAAGNEKFSSYQAKVGVHGASDQNGQETALSNSATIGMARVIKELGVPASIIGKMVVTPPDKMIWLTVDDLRSMDTKMFGKPIQTATSSSDRPQLPIDITPSTQATAPTSQPPTWSKLVAGAISLSSSQNNGRPRIVRTCQPELKVCVMGVYYKNNSNKEAFVKVTEDVSGKVIRREVCELNSYSDVRECFVWDTGTIRRDMKNAKGDWYEVERKELGH